MRRSPGVTLLELLVVLGILGVLFGLGGVSLVRLRDRSAVDQGAAEIAAQFSAAKSRARRDSRDVTVDISPSARTVRLLRGTTVLTTSSLPVGSLSITCRTTCTGTAFTVKAPGGVLDQDIKVTLRSGSAVRQAYFLGPKAAPVMRD